MAKVIARIKGGLGNQLFCYAAARRLASVNAAELVIDDVTGFVRDHHHRRRYMLDAFQLHVRKATSTERMEPFERYRRGIAKLLARRQSFHRRKYIEQEGINFDHRLLDLKVGGSVYLDGLWQSEKYFRDVESTIRSDLAIDPINDESNRTMAARICSCESVAVHVRCFERATEGAAFRNVKGNYYSRAAQCIVERVQEPHFFLFSDDLSQASQIVDIPGSQVTPVDVNPGDDGAYGDLALLSLCKHFIIANSTFSWWGAWLSRSPRKTIISPSQVSLVGLQGWGFAGLIPEKWLVL